MYKEDCDAKREVDSMNAATLEQRGYKRLNFNSLTFDDGKNVNEGIAEEITPIQWSEEVLAGDKQVIIKKR